MDEEVTLEDKVLIKELYPELEGEELTRATKNFKRYAEILERMFEKRKRSHE